MKQWLAKRGCTFEARRGSHFMVRLGDRTAVGKEDMLQYRIRLTKDTNDTFLVTVLVDPPGFTSGKTREEARARAVEAIETAFIGYIHDGRDIPPSDTGRGNMVTIPAIGEAKLGLYSAMRTAAMTKAELARRLAPSTGRSPTGYEPRFAHRANRGSVAGAR